jgi:hypothetical protein
MTVKLEGPTDSHSLALVGGLKGKANTNSSTRMFSLSSLMSMLDEEFDALREDEQALLTTRFERLHENRVNMTRNTRTLRPRLPGEGREQGWLQAQVKDGWQVQVEA